MPRLGYWITLLGICLVALLTSGAARAADTTMFDEGRAQQAFKAIEDKVGHKLRVLDVTIRADELTVAIPDTATPGNAEIWQVSQKGLLGLLGAAPARMRSERAQIISGSLEDNLIDVDADAIAIVPKLAAAALARARLQTQGKITEMELRRLPKIIEPGVRDPSWLIHVEGVAEEADISANVAGEITFADLNHTLRAEKLNLLAGGPDLDEMVQNIRGEIKGDWTFHYIEIDKTAIDFDVTLNSLGARARMTRFIASLNGIRTDPMGMPHGGFPGTQPDPPFNFSDIDWSMLPKIEQAAKDRLQIADGVVQMVELTKPERITGGGIEWEVRIKSANAPLFWNPSQPPVEEGTVAFDMKGNVVRTKFPPGHGPQANLFDAAALQKAIATISQRLGAHLQVSELRVDADRIAITAQDPKDPKKFAVFTYKDEDVSRGNDIEAQVANAFGAGPDWLWDLALLQPSAVQPLAAMEQQTMTKTGVTNGKVTRITFSKDKMFHASNDRPLIEIRVSGDDQHDEWVYFDFAGNIADPDQGSAGGGRSSSGGASRDEQDCTGSDPERVIAGCTRMTQSRNESPHNRAIAFYNRGGVYQKRGDFDRAAADAGEAIKLDPQYANAYLNRGFAYASKGDNDHAIADFDRTIELNPEEPAAYLDRGIVRYAKHDDDGAIADLSEALKRGIKEPVVYSDRAAAYHRKGDNQKAVADYTEALTLKPNDPKTLVDRGQAYEAMKDNDHAMADFDAAIKADPKYGVAYDNRGFLYRNQGKFDEAVVEYAQVIKLDPKNAAAYVGLGYVYRAQGKLDDALADFNQLIKIDPSSIVAYLNRGLILLAKGDQDGAIADFSAAVKIDAKNATAYQYRGVAYYLAGSLPKALADLTQANALAPADAYTAMLLDIVGQRSKLQSSLGQTSGKLDMTVWPAPVVRLLLGQMTMEALLAAGDDTDPVAKRKHVCEASFYPGELALLRGDRDGATKLFSTAAAECPLAFEEWTWAGAELKAAGVTPPARTP